MSLSPTLTCFFISSVKSRRGEEGDRLTGEGRELVGDDGEWKFPLVETKGHSSLGRRWQQRLLLLAQLSCLFEAYLRQ